MFGLQGRSCQWFLKVKSMNRLFKKLGTKPSINLDNYNLKSIKKLINFSRYLNKKLYKIPTVHSKRFCLSKKKKKLFLNK